jgi:hypothetical protein
MSRYRQSLGNADFIMAVQMVMCSRPYAGFRISIYLLTLLTWGARPAACSRDLAGCSSSKVKDVAVRRAVKCGELPNRWP